MKKFSFLFVAFSLLTAVQSMGQAFITKWKTDHPGASNSISITIQKA